jgi:hypothetical protein
MTVATQVFNSSVAVVQGLPTLSPPPPVFRQSTTSNNIVEE